MNLFSTAVVFGGMLLAYSSVWSQSTSGRDFPSTTPLNTTGMGANTATAQTVAPKTDGARTTNAVVAANGPAKPCNCPPAGKRVAYKRKPGVKVKRTAIAIRQQAPSKPPLASSPLPAALVSPTPAVVARRDSIVAPRMPRIVAYPYTLPIDKHSIKGAYVMGISDHKTTHIIFTSKIRDFDAGSSDVLALVPDHVGNILRVKASEGKPFEQTNMTVITEGGELYSFLVHFDPDPPVLTFNIANNQLSDEVVSAQLGINRSNGVSVLPGKEDKEEPVDGMVIYAERVARARSFIRNVGATNLKINVQLTGLYVQGGSVYLQLGIANESQIDYPVDFVKFYIRDKDVLKRVAAQEIELPSRLRFPDVTLYKAQTGYTQVFAIPIQTFTEEKVLEVELYEKQGGRHIRFQIESDIFIKARTI